MHGVPASRLDEKDVPRCRIVVQPLSILYEDNHCIAVNKPAGLPTTHYSGREATLDQTLRTYLKEKYRKPGNVFLGVVHRLDKLVSGVVLFARTSKAAARLSLQFREHQVEKIYWAIVEVRPNCPPLGDETLEDWLIQRHELCRVEVRPSPSSECPLETPGAKRAITHCTVIRRGPGKAFVELRPKTGRKHQLRVQLAHRGFPIWGDDKYGSMRRLPWGIALHARRLVFRHPTTHETISLVAQLPDNWSKNFANLLASVRLEP